MFMKSGKVVIRTKFDAKNGSRPKTIFEADAEDVHTLPSVGEYIFVPNENGHGDDLKVLHIWYDLDDNITTVGVESDRNNLYSDLSKKV